MTSVDWLEKLQSQTAMPECSTGSAIRTAHEDMGQDYSNTVSVGADRSCLVKWQAALVEDEGYLCRGTPLQCTRYDENHRYDEEWATVTFVSPNRATVSFTKI